jgi:hypothetical protein
MIPNDPHSFASQGQALVKHLSLNLEVDFTKKQLSGTATWKIENPSGVRSSLTQKEFRRQVVLDNGKETTFTWRHRSHIREAPC